MSLAHEACESKHHLDAGLKVLIRSITGFHKACSVGVRAATGGVVAQDVVQPISERRRNYRRAGVLPRRKREGPS
jgi:hypothetical protein